MKHHFLLTACAIAASLATAEFAQAQDSTGNTLEQIVVTGKRANRVSKGATGLAMDVKDTPQSISSIDKDDMADFGLSGSNEALRMATGINVEQYETNRATFNSRGFEIQLTQVDGLGMTNSWGTVVGREDTFLFERIELIRGANGLLTGVGNSSGTINYIRKRPTNTDGGEVGVSFGSWGLKRAELDYNKVLTTDGRWAGRLVVATEDKDSWIRDLHDRRNTVYGVIDGQIGDNGVLTVGLTAVDSKQNSPMWGSLTLLRADGTQADFPVGSSTSADWTYWNTKSYNAFAEYTHRLADNWEAKLTYNVRHGNEATKLLYAYTNTGTLNNDNTGLIGWPYRSLSSTDDTVLDANVSGQFSAFGRKHSLLVGISRSHEKTSTDTFAAESNAFLPLPAFPYGGDTYPEPSWGARTPSTAGEQTLTRLYVASRLALTDSFKAVVGLNAARLVRGGDSQYGSGGQLLDPKTSKLSPYLGFTYDITPDVLGYVSYSDIFQAQEQNDVHGFQLAPMKGVNTEAGIKAEWLGKALLTTFAVFTAKQQGLATYAGIDSNQQYYYEPKDVRSKGFEAEATGRIGKDAKVSLGYTHLMLTGPDGNDIYEWIPRNTLKARVESRVPALPALRLGLGARWQSDISKIGSAVQPAYAVADAFAAWELNPKTTLRLNVNNLSDRKYITGLAYGAVYGEPRNFAVSLDYKL
ncbi:TonB-dependent siderophore receptor [Pelomonas sp. KK5]|uniref:TonB-dependent siderophore receptor n=1 Tax=Pelomonas sp. KK5 TaxID=1855730 RepID=UPI00097C2D0E|nr:TonB-dependent siderophore receptor [Pelomonas sp. KK5]